LEGFSVEQFKGTTTIGLVCRDGVILASDKRASWGYFVASKEARKVYQINDFVGATVAGSVGDAEMLMRIIQAEASLYEMNTRNKMSCEAVATLMANVLHGSRYFPLLVQILVAGYDFVRNSGRVFSLDPIGGLTEETMASTGSGSPMVYGVLEQEYSPKKTVSENIYLAVKALYSAMERDLATGNGIKLAVITEKGFKEYPDEEAKKIYESVKKERI